MGQKTNSTIFRLGLKNSEWKYKYIEKNFEESSLYLTKNLQIKNYLENIFKFYGLIIQNFKIEHTQNTVNIYIFYFEQKLKTTKLFLENFKKLKNENKNLIYPINSKQLILFLTTHILNISLKLYIPNKTINLNIQDINKNFENKTIKKNQMLYKEILPGFKKFLKDPFLKNFIKILFVVVSEKNSSKLLSTTLAYYFQISKKRHNYLLFFIKKTLDTLITSKFSKILGIKICILGRLNGAPRAKKKLLKIGVVPLQSFNSSISYSNSVSYTQNGTFGIKVWICEKIYLCFYNLKDQNTKKLEKEFYQT